MHGGISIHLAPLALGNIAGIEFTNTLFTALVVSVLLVIFAFFAGRNLKMKPSKFQLVVESIVTLPYQFAKDTLENDKVTERVYPLLLTLFLFVLCVNWFGLLPFVASVGVTGLVHGEPGLIPFFYPVSTDLNFTLALALIAFFAIEIFGIATLGAFKYGGKFITFASPLAFITGVIELISEVARIITFSFRLFGNIFAGKVLILVIMFFVPLFLPIPFLAFEVFVGFIQAVIFALLTLFFIKIAITSHEEGHEDAHEAHPAPVSA
jgi:F-type H+-transporting ATPase subunit a